MNRSEVLQKVYFLFVFFLMCSDSLLNRNSDAAASVSLDLFGSTGIKVPTSRVRRRGMIPRWDIPIVPAGPTCPPDDHQPDHHCSQQGVLSSKSKKSTSVFFDASLQRLCDTHRRQRDGKISEMRLMRSVVFEHFFWSLL